MAKRNQSFETIIGFIVILCAAAFLTFALKITNTKTVSKYDLKAKFENVDGILVGSDVKISGIKIGAVTNQYIDNETYTAIVTVSIDKEIKLPEDSAAKIVTSGLVGSKFLEIEPGAEDAMLKPGDEIKYTQSTINLEDLISRFVFKSNDKSNDENKNK